MNQFGLLKDNVANKILRAESCREYLASIIAAVLKIEKEYVMKNLRLMDAKVNRSHKNKEQELDVIVENDYLVINIEVNYRNNKKTRIKNNSYLAQLLIRQTSPGFDYNKLKPIIQININNFDLYQKKEFLYRSIMMEDKYHLERSEGNIEIYDINIDFLSKISYNEIEKLSERDLKWLLYIFVCKDYNRIQIYKNNEMMRKVQEKMNEIMDELDNLLYYNREEFNRKAEEEEKEELRKQAREQGLEEGRQEGRKIGLKEGLKEGIKEGSKQNSIKIAKRMLTLPDITIEQVAEITSLSIEEIETINIK